MATAPNQMLDALRGPQVPIDPAMAALFSQPQQRLQQMAGDVVPLPINPRETAGPAHANVEQLLNALLSGKVVQHPALAPILSPQPTYFSPKP